MLAQSTSANTPAWSRRRSGSLTTTIMQTIACRVEHEQRRAPRVFRNPCEQRCRGRAWMTVGVCRVPTTTTSVRCVGSPGFVIERVRALINSLPHSLCRERRHGRGAADRAVRRGAVVAPVARRPERPRRRRRAPVPASLGPASRAHRATPGGCGATGVTGPQSARNRSDASPPNRL